MAHYAAGANPTAAPEDTGSPSSGSEYSDEDDYGESNERAVCTIGAAAAAASFAAASVDLTRSYKRV